jgi:hypothetical protein
MNKTLLIFALGAVVLLTTAPTIFGNAIITGKALIIYLATSGLIAFLIKWYEQRRSAT